MQQILDNPWFLAFMRWGHFLAGITWIGILYFFNAVSAKLLSFQQSNFMGSLDAQTKAKVYPVLMPKALWWFRWGALWTVIFGLVMYAVYVPQHVSDDPTRLALKVEGILLLIIYILNFGALALTASDKNKPVHWTLILFCAILSAYALLAPMKMGANSYVTTITAGGGFGILMMLNVWGIIWRNQKKIIQAFVDQAAGKPAPPDLAQLTKVAGVASRTNFWMSLPLLFFMGTASHLPLSASQSVSMRLF